MLSNYTYIIAPVIAYFIAQTIKAIIEGIRDRKFRVGRWLFGSGGMPSAHTASVIALVTKIARAGGFRTQIFALAFWFACIVIVDAVGVRRQAGKQAVAINDITEEMKENKWEFQIKELKEEIGHSPSEVGGGIILGILIGMIV